MDKLPSNPTCQVCGLFPSVGVACVPGIPVSVAYCHECLVHEASPLSIIRANIAMCGGLQNMVLGYGEMVVYHKDDEYLTIEAELTKRPLTHEELNDSPG